MLVSANMVDFTEQLIQKIKLQARQYVDDNIRNPSPSDYLYTENAFLCGASILAVYETELEGRNAKV